MDRTERVAAALRGHGLAARIERFPAGTATAQAAAAAVSCQLGQIVKTLIFLANGRPTAVLVAGDRQVHTAALARLLGVSQMRLKMGAPAQVIELTVFAVGGVAPLGLPHPWDVIADESLDRFEQVWAAAGESDAVFAIRTVELLEVTGAQRAAITKPAAQP